jgi:hypothetical protein
MKKLRTLLEEIKKLDDIQREATNRPPKNAMILYPPAAPEAVKRLIGGGWNHPLPPSFGEFLAASDGVSKFRGRLDFLSTEASRQEPIRSVVEKRIEQDNIDLRAMFKQVDNAAIEKWESDPDNYYLPNHAVIAVAGLSGLLFYDSRTRDAKGEMELCWAAVEDGAISKRYDNIERYLEAALQDAKKAVGA